MNTVAVVGAGPNGLAAAAVAARAGLSVIVYEANDTIGGAARTQPLEGSSAKFDLGSAVHPMAMLSPAMHELNVHQRVDFIVPELSFAHVLDERTAYAWRDLERTGQELGGNEGQAYTRLLAPLVQRIEQLGDTLLNPLLRVPAHPLTLGIFAASTLGAMALKDLVSAKFPHAAALYAGCAAHVAGGSRGPANAGAGLFLAAAAHSDGWAVPRGGSQAISDALAAELLSHGGTIQTGHRVSHVDELDAETVLLDTSAEAAAHLTSGKIPDKLATTLAKTRRSPGSCLVHFVLAEPIPWKDPVLNQTSTVHLGGTAAQIGQAERRANRKTSETPYLIVAQPSLFDDSRAATGDQVIWAYCHVPLGSEADMSRQISAQIEAAAPGFRELIKERYVVPASELEQQNAALVGGDLSGGTMDLLGSVMRPRLSAEPWYLQSEGLYLVSSATPPGPSVHGMAGYLGAQAMLRREYSITT